MERASAYSAVRFPPMHAGYSKGHLAAVALHKNSVEDLRSTFSLGANIVPQNQAVNANQWYDIARIFFLLSLPASYQIAAGNRERERRVVEECLLICPADLCT